MLLKLVSCVSGESYQGEGRGKALAEFPRRGLGALRGRSGAGQPGRSWRRARVFHGCS